MSGSGDVTYQYSVASATFMDGSVLTGSWDVEYDSSGTIVSINDVDVTVTGPAGSTTFTGLGTLPYANPATATNDSGNTVDYYDVHNFGGQSNGDYQSLYLDWKSEEPNNLAKSNDGGNLFTSIGYPTDPNNPQKLTTYKLVAAAPIVVTEITCFFAGTAIATPGGAVAVEALHAGDLVTLCDGRQAPIRWIGRQTVSTRFADPLRVLPIRVRAGALGEGLPARDLLLSPCHALLVDDILVQAGALVNGRSIRREPNVPETFIYYHVELADHALILAEDVPAETFIDNVGRMGFDNWAEHEALADGETGIVEMAYPRAKSVRQVPVAVRSRLFARAVSLTPGVAVAA